MKVNILLAIFAISLFGCGGYQINRGFSDFEDSASRGLYIENLDYVSEGTVLNAFVFKNGYYISKHEITLKNGFWFYNDNLILDNSGYVIYIVYPYIEDLNLQSTEPYDTYSINIDCESGIDYLVGYSKVNNQSPVVNVKLEHILTKVYFRFYSNQDGNILNKITLSNLGSGVYRRPFITKVDYVISGGIRHTITDFSSYEFFEGNYVIPINSNEYLIERFFYPTPGSNTFPCNLTLIINDKTYFNRLDTKWEKGKRYFYEIFVDNDIQNSEYLELKEKELDLLEYPKDLL